MWSVDCKQSWCGCKWQVRIYILNLCVQNVQLILRCVMFCIFATDICSQVPNAPLCIALPPMVARQCASCWLQAKLTWMQRTGAHLYIEFAADFVLYFVFWILLLIFCSSDQRTALHGAASRDDHGDLAVCKLLIASKANVNAEDRCAFCVQNLLTILCCIVIFEVCF